MVSQNSHHRFGGNRTVLSFHKPIDPLNTNIAIRRPQGVDPISFLKPGGQIMVGVDQDFLFRLKHIKIVGDCFYPDDVPLTAAQAIIQQAP